MKNIILLALLFVGTGFVAFAQSTADTKLSIGADIGLPLDEANKVFNLVYGPSLKIEIPFSIKGPIFTITGGYEIFNLYNPNNASIISGKYIPFSVGLKDYFQNSIIFLEGDVGASFYVNSNYTGNSTAFLFAPTIGISLAKNKLDISARYEERDETYGELRLIALRVAFKFNSR